MVWKTAGRISDYSTRSLFFPHLSPCPSRSYLQSEYLLIQQDILFLNNLVVVVVAEKPVFESALLGYLIQEIRQRICLIKSTAQEDPHFRRKQRALDARGAMYRVNYLSWWKEELPSEDEYQTARANLEKAGRTVSQQG